jgi:hypothetical protein
MSLGDGLFYSGHVEAIFCWHLLEFFKFKKSEVPDRTGHPLLTASGTNLLLLGLGLTQIQWKHPTSILKKVISLKMILKEKMKMSFVDGEWVMFVLGSIRVWAQSFMLPQQMQFRPHLQVLYSHVGFGDWDSFFIQAYTMILPHLSLLHSLGWQACTTTPSHCLRWDLTNHLPRLALSCSPGNLSLPSN